MKPRGWRVTVVATLAAMATAVVVLLGSAPARADVCAEHESAIHTCAQLGDFTLRVVFTDGEFPVVGEGLDGVCEDNGEPFVCTRYDYFLSDQSGNNILFMYLPKTLEDVDGCGQRGDSDPTTGFGTGNTKDTCRVPNEAGSVKLYVKGRHGTEPDKVGLKVKNRLFVSPGEILSPAEAPPAGVTEEKVVIGEQVFTIFTTVTGQVLDAQTDTDPPARVIPIANVGLCVPEVGYEESPFPAGPVNVVIDGVSYACEGLSSVEPDRCTALGSPGCRFIGGSCVTSDRALKENFRTVDGRAILERLNQVPVLEWNYLAEAPGTRHVGPMAQDFHAAFGLGESERHINTVDATGVALRAIQALYEMAQAVEAKTAELEAKTQALEALRQHLDELQPRGGPGASQP